MDLSFRAIHDIVHPTAAFSEPDTDEDDDQGPGPDQGQQPPELSSWDSSQLNPKNRVDSLGCLSNPLWRIDGSAGLGTQYYAIPLFLDSIAPMRIDVFVLEGALYPPVVRRVLDLDRAFHTKDAVRVRRLGIAQHILRILQWHTTAADGRLHPEVVEELYRRGPFGSFLVIENLTLHVHQSRIAVSRNYPLESDLLSYHELLAMWGLGGEAGPALPPEVSIQDVQLVRQMHDSICLVRIPRAARAYSAGGGDSGETEPVILKSLTSGVKYMYHELRALLKSPLPQAHIIGRPLHVISKPCLFGGKRGVVGFTIPYYPTGSLRDILPMLRVHGQLAPADQFRWSRQIAEAMCHIWYQRRDFYPDLRLDNIVLDGPSPQGDVVVIDFEQRGVWSGFSAPEVDFVENLRILACDDPESDSVIPPELSDHYRLELVKVWNAGHPPSQHTSWPAIERLEQETKYSNPPDGYNIPWSCLTRPEQEAAMVYMLGRVLWCIFEGMSAPHRGAVWQSYRWEPEELEFPDYRLTPPAVQKIINRCFGDVGAKKQTTFVRRVSKLYMEEKDEEDGGNPQYGGTKGHGRSSSSNDEGWAAKLVSDNLESRAGKFWWDQLSRGEVWLRERNRLVLADSEDCYSSDANHASHDDGGSKGGSAHGRPSLGEVLSWLNELPAQPGYD